MLWTTPKRLESDDAVLLILNLTPFVFASDETINVTVGLKNCFSVNVGI